MKITGSESSDQTADCVIQLTEEQANYLANWEEGKCSPESEQAFIESLQQYVLSMMDNK